MAILDSVSIGGTIYNIRDTETNNGVAQTFSASVPYSQGQYVWYDGILYCFTSAHAAGAWNASHVERIDIGSVLTDIQNEIYQPMAISTLTVNPSNVEIGSTVTSATLTYGMNKVPVSATLDGTAQTITSKSGTISKTGLSLTADKTWTLSATDDRGATASKTVTLHFLNTAYWGAAATGTINSAFLLALSGSTLASGKARTFTVTAGENQYIWYAVPSRFGTCTFTVGGFTGGFTKVSTFSHTNASGYSENYDVYRSDNANLGNTTVEVS